ncbi:hypothetical protein PCURB6_16250 [Paenibacillus curdlanolyticus]|nr:hypothetical protein PCURB6_16250 [Paenibacillus curdlanolyticus]
MLETSDVKNMLACSLIFNPSGALTSFEIDFCSKLVSSAFSYDKDLQRRRDEEATLFCKGQRYTHKYPVYTL